MAAKRKDEQAKQMYLEYQKGFSLSEIGAMFGISRQSVYELFKTRKFKLRSVVALPYQFFKGEKFSLRNTGYYGRTTGDRKLMHILVWEDKHGKIPKGHDIHHIDHNKANNSIENLTLYTKAEHARKFATGYNQHTKKVV